MYGYKGYVIPGRYSWLNCTMQKWQYACTTSYTTNQSRYPRAVTHTYCLIKPKTQTWKSIILSHCIRIILEFAICYVHMYICTHKYIKYQTKCVTFLVSKWLILTDPVTYAYMLIGCKLYLPGLIWTTVVVHNSNCPEKFTKHFNIMHTPKTIQEGKE